MSCSLFSKEFSLYDNDELQQAQKERPQFMLKCSKIIGATYMRKVPQKGFPNFSKDFLDSELDENFFLIKKDTKFNNLQNSQLLDINNISLPRNIKYCDRLSMINGVEARLPFLDHKLANYLFGLENKYNKAF